MTRRAAIVRAAGICKCLCYSFLLSNAAVAQTPPSFQDWKATLDQSVTGTYYWDGDLPAHSDDDLLDYYNREFFVPPDPSPEPRKALVVVRTINGADSLWDKATAQNLTYCIQKGTNLNLALPGLGGFVESVGQYDDVRRAMRDATRDWEASANVNFIHRSQFDEDCIDLDPGEEVLFRVLKSNATTLGNRLLAAAFFPDAPPSQRILQIAGDATGNPPRPLSLRGILRHELGHILGLVHEHAPTEACFEAGEYRAVTDYDVFSVMHYRRNQCPVGVNLDYFLTDTDKLGISELYPDDNPSAPPPSPPPVPDPDPPPPPNPGNPDLMARIRVVGPAYPRQVTVLDATASTAYRVKDGVIPPDPIPEIVRYEWQFGDGSGVTSSTTPVVEHVYVATGSYTVTLTVEDDSGNLSPLASETIDVVLSPSTVILPAVLHLLLE